MAPDTNLQTADRDKSPLFWTRRLSLRTRILAVNLVTIVLIMAGLFFLDSYRTVLIDKSLEEARLDARLLADILPSIEASRRSEVLGRVARVKEQRIRIYDRAGNKLLDSFDLTGPTYDLRKEPEKRLVKQLARRLDNVIDFIVVAEQPPLYIEPAADDARAWPELKLSAAQEDRVRLRYAADATPVISATARSDEGSYRIMLTRNPREIRAQVRSERADLFLFFLFAIIVSVLLSLFLARTIARPLGSLARAATKVKLGREREVSVPRLPERSDEIGLLARALSDMTNALRTRIDATENFAADVAHEIKNPIASLRSALDTLDKVEDPALRTQLMSVAKDDVRRMDRLISDISEASRVDSQLSRAKFERIDLGEMIEQVLDARMHHHDAESRNVRIAFARPRRRVAVVMGEDMRLERVLNNLVDNAISFSPPGGLVEVQATVEQDDVLITVRDEGPGVPESEREEIFRRFHSARPKDEQFGKHSGLGLAIARTIIEGHQGHILVRDRDDGESGAVFEIRLPSANGRSE